MSVEVNPRTLSNRFDAACSDAKIRSTINTFAWNTVGQLPDMDRDDIKQELLIVLWRCVQNYDPDRGASFLTLFMGSARNHVIGLVRASNVQKRGKGRIATLSDEQFADAVEHMRTEGSAEDWALALMDLGERFCDELEIAHDRLAS